MQFIIIVNIYQLSGAGDALFTDLKRHPGQCQFDFYFQSTVQRHHKWKEASQVEGYIEKPAKVCQAVALSPP